MGVDLLCVEEYLLLGNWSDWISIKCISTSVSGDTKLRKSAHTSSFLMNIHAHKNTLPTHSRVFLHMQTHRLITSIVFLRLVRSACSNAYRSQYMHLFVCVCIHAFPWVHFHESVSLIILLHFVVVVRFLAVAFLKMSSGETYYIPTIYLIRLSLRQWRRQ